MSSSSEAYLGALLDPGSFVSWDSPVEITSDDPAYRAELVRAAKASGHDESVVTGTGRIEGRQVAVVVGAFEFLAGSIGTAAARRIIAAFERATAARLPLLAAPASGGTRMQEGTRAFVLMADIARAVGEHRRHGLLYVAHLRHPTTGGAFASWGSLAHFTAAEPGALLAFSGPRVYATLMGTRFPEGVQTAENLAARGVIDAVLTAGEMGATMARIMRVTEARSLRPAAAGALGRPPDGGSTWDSVLLSRDTGRPGLRELLARAADVVEFHGTNEGERDDAVVVATASLGGVSWVVAGHDRAAPAPMGPAGLRQAQRAMDLAEQLGLPLLTVVDTAGADLSPAAEEGALAGEIARCLARMTALTVPSVSVILGQGTGGGALALVPARRVVAAQHAWLSPLLPEGASAIVHRDTAHAAEMVERQGVGSGTLFANGVVHEVVPEPYPAHVDPEPFLAGVVAACVRQLRVQN
ncbi:putative acetyl-coenzyme A carboxylase carboxyl transferase subunit beta [Streptomyces sp. RB5]|uniref:Putative acetyl-coenzyme A carboxylase carboxyl transferase subunit beta n=1 Tax=Streptomyces smaragdinus TaxID=2585196 RepID=A0A7K0CLM7_9ACTN|nr:carboxyl transferase domain-containing protein [Streptomyces smaragdinus]MQY14321.1 putative acetyl-coenzyme A carboxylase carboxyl transferase subunit beta [Streptomyces smaragdinus]